MFCKRCGTENADDAKFCKGCGRPLGNTSEVDKGKEYVKTVSEQENGRKDDTNAVSNEAPKKQNDIKHKPISKVIPIAIGAGIAGVALICLIAFAVITNRRTIDLDKYLSISTTGYDGYGTAATSIDWEKMEEKYKSRIAFKPSAKKDLGGMLKMMTPMDAVKLCVSVNLDEDSNLSNGDTISYEWDIDEDLAKYVKCRVKFKDGSYEVADLAEVGKFDPFDDIDVSFSGISPSGQMMFNYSGSELSEYDFHCDKMNGLKNGDRVEISISNPNMDYYAQQFGKIPENLSETYTVSGLQEYVSTYEDLSEEFINDLKNEAQDLIYSYTASSYNKASSLNNLEYAGYILESIKSGDGLFIDSYNDLYIIYKGDVSNSEEEFNTTKVYFPVRFTNILKRETGELSYEDNRGIEGFSEIKSIWYGTKGYTNPITCYLEIVERNREYYVAECGDGFEIYSEYNYIEKLEDISESYRENLYADARDKIESYIASDYNKESHVENLEVFGEYLLTEKLQDNGTSTKNKYIVVFSADLTNSEGRFEDTKIYYPVEYDGIVKLPADEYMYTKAAGILTAIIATTVNGILFSIADGI